MVELLKDRLAKAMALPRKSGGVTSIQMLADACGISYQAVKKWLTNPDASLTAVNNHAAAAYLGVRSDWLAVGEGPMLAGHEQNPFRAPVTLDRALSRLGDALAGASDEARRKAAPLLQALITNPEQAGQLAPMIVTVLEQPEQPGRANQTAEAGL